MTPTQKISSTAYPDGTLVKYLFGMKKPEVICYGELMKKAALKEAVRNLPKSGGAAFEDEAESFVEECKNHLALNR